MKPRQRVLGPTDERNPARRGRHGLSADEIEYLTSLGCAVCHVTGVPLQVDHDHRAGCHPGPVGCRNCVRGMCCQRCNAVLRWIEDSPAIADSLASYLRVTAAR